jgi:alkaline phosphatase D
MEQIRVTTDRRTLLFGSAAALLLPGRLSAQPLAGFTHGVASGEPGSRSMLFWTRFVGSGNKPVPLQLELFTSPRLTRPVMKGEVFADPANDWCAKISLTGLSPATTYYYRFQGPSKARSITGRTRTLPEGQVERFRLGVASCSNLPFGFFNGYAAMAAADDIDLFLHLGDYIYEYPRGTYPAAAQVVPGRIIEPAGELLALADYRARYASYRTDPDLQMVHAMFPAVTTWDDHEIANDAWAGGAENHDPRTEGPWEARLAAARKAYREWMPVSDAPYASYDIGRLLTLHRLDTRVEGREQQLDLAQALKTAGAGGDMTAAMMKFRDEQWMRGSRQLLGTAQEKWLMAGFEAARQKGMRWQVLAQQVVMGNLKAPPDPSAFMAPNLDPQIAARLRLSAAASRAGLPLNMDAWDGYPAARGRLLAAAQKAGANLVVLAGDTHNAWAFDLQNDGKPAGVEFATQSITSPGFETYLPVPPSDLAKALMATNPSLRWCDTERRGYTHVTLTPATALAEWRFTAPIAARSAKIVATQRAQVAAGTNRLRMG